MASQSSTKQNGEATTEEVPGSIVTYTGEEINTFKDDMAPQWKHEKEYAACNRPESWYLEKYKTELNLNSISKTFQDTYLILIAMLNFQCFRLDASLLSVLPGNDVAEYVLFVHLTIQLYLYFINDYITQFLWIKINHNYVFIPLSSYFLGNFLCCIILLFSCILIYIV